MHDLHLTLIAPWKTIDVMSITKHIDVSVRDVHPFYLELRKLTYGPDEVHRRYLWIECTPSAELITLRLSLVKALRAADGIARNDDALITAIRADSSRRFLPHITIARLKGLGERMRSTADVNVPLSLRMRVSSVELFESLKQGSVKYAVLHSARFQGRRTTIM
ncbi:MAG: 2'-5' RNA ligase family protein [Ignavibacteria bacterium]|nr:2'-5' RNA ligase family protein [Ignavibacteria bacterium]